MTIEGIMTAKECEDSEFKEANYVVWKVEPV